jgi:hypothetical protein
MKQSGTVSKGFTPRSTFISFYRPSGGTVAFLPMAPGSPDRAGAAYSTSALTMPSALSSVS